MVIPGEYYLQGVRETASGFLLNPDGTFQFFFTYGALDRYGSGKWLENDGYIILNSLAKPLQDFALIKSSKTENDQLTIRIEDNNRNLLKYAYASLENGADNTWVPASDEGLIIFPKQTVKTISLLFEFCPERFSVIAIGNEDHNDFSFRFEPWIVEVFLADFRLKKEQNSLVGQHPLLEGQTYRYEKQSEY